MMLLSSNTMPPSSYNTCTVHCKGKVLTSTTWIVPLKWAVCNLGYVVYNIYGFTMGRGFARKPPLKFRSAGTEHTKFGSTK